MSLDKRQSSHNANVSSLDMVGIWLSLTKFKSCASLELGDNTDWQAPIMHCAPDTTSPSPAHFIMIFRFLFLYLGVLAFIIGTKLILELFRQLIINLSLVFLSLFSHQNKSTSSRISEMASNFYSWGEEDDDKTPSFDKMGYLNFSADEAGNDPSGSPLLLLHSLIFGGGTLRDTFFFAFVFVIVWISVRM